MNIQYFSKQQIWMITSRSAWLIFVVLCLLQASRSQVQKCQNPQYIIPYDPLDSAFDTGFDTIRGKQEMITLIENPTAENAKSYLVSLAPFSAPLFAMAGITLAIFIATIVQVICFNTCSKECCGNEINSATYNVCCFRTMVAAFLIISFLTMSISIAALIFNSDLQKAIDFTQCNTQNIVYETYNGNTNTSINWSGINNFQVSIDQFSVAIQNNVPFLTTYFSASNPSYNPIIDTQPGSSYSNSQIFNCANSPTTISCPFPSSSTCSSTYQATFNAQFCNNTFTGSAANLIKNEMTTKSSTWRSNTVQIAADLSIINTNPSDVQKLVNSLSSFTNQIGTYQSSIQKGFTQLDKTQNSVSIAFYVFYSFTLALSLLGITSLCMAYFCNSFKCRYCMYIFWYLFFLVSLLLWIDSGFFLAGAVAFQDSCLAYPYFFKQNVNNFNQLSFANNQIGSIFKTCFYSQNANTKSIFSGFEDTSILAQFGNLYSIYSEAIPSNQFTTVVTTIENTLTNYRANPNTVTIQNVPAAQQPQIALNQMNQFANTSANGTTQSCKYSHDYVTYDVINCGLYLTNPPAVTPSQNLPNTCVVLFSSSINGLVTDRVNGFNSKNCTTDANTYQSRVNALISYGQSINSIVSALAPVQQSNTPLQNYQANYFNYYSNVLNFYNIDIQQIFNGFFNPYNTLQDGSNCGFVSTSMNGIVDIACNQLEPYISSFSALNIIESVFLFVLFILSYFLTTRLEFYEYLEGNFANYQAPTISTKQLQQTYQLDTTNSRNVELLTPADNSKL